MTHILQQNISENIIIFIIYLIKNLHTKQGHMNISEKV